MLGGCIFTWGGAPRCGRRRRGPLAPARAGGAGRRSAGWRRADRRRWRVPACRRRRGASELRASSAARAAAMRQSARGSRVVGVDQQLLAGLGVATIGPGRGRAAPSPAGRTGARRPPRGAPVGQPCSQPGLADEVGDDEHRAAARTMRRPGSAVAFSCVPPRPSAGRCAGAHAAGAAHAAARARRASRCRRGAVEQAPTRLPWRVSRRASTATNSRATARLADVGAEVDAGAEVEQEPRGHLAVFGEHAHVGLLQPRAVTFQSMWRTSSWCWYSRRSARSSPAPRASACGSRPAAGRRDGGSPSIRGGAAGLPNRGQAAAPPGWRAMRPRAACRVRGIAAVHHLLDERSGGDAVGQRLVADSTTRWRSTSGTRSSHVFRQRVGAAAQQASARAPRSGRWWRAGWRRR